MVQEAILSPFLFHHFSSYPNVHIYFLSTHLFSAYYMPTQKPTSTVTGLASKTGKGLAEGVVLMTYEGFPNVLEEQETGAAGEEAEHKIAPSGNKEFPSETQTLFPLRVSWRLCSSHH